MISQYTFQGTESGKSILALGAIHGKETCGTAAMQKIMDKIKSEHIKLISGSITFIPICNPKAYEAGERYIDKNLNRVFTKHKNPTCYEENLANILTNYIENHDYVLDIHSFDACGEPFVFQDYLDEQTAEFAKAVGIRNIISGWPEVYAEQDAFNEGDTVAYAHKYGKIGIVVECGQHKSPETVSTAEQAILKALEFLGITQGNADISSQEPLTIRAQKLFYKQHEGHLAKNWKHLDYVAKNEVIATYDNGEKITASEDCHILLPKPADIGGEWFYVGVKE